MTIDTLTCPYCNAAIAAPPGLTAGQRLVCPRCGDAFSFRPLDAITGQAPPARDTAITTTAPPVAEARMPPRRSNGWIAAAIVGVMFLMAGLGLTFMLMTQDVRRAHDTSRPPRRPYRQRGVLEPDKPDDPILATVAPDKLAALAYVPSGVNFLAAARITELRASAAGAKLLREPIKIGGSAYRLEKLLGWAGLRGEEVDHVVFAVRVDDSFPPPFYLILRTIEPLDGEALRQRLHGASVPSVSKKKLFSFHPQQRDFTLQAWPADAHTLVLALLPGQLESLPNEPSADLHRLPDELRSVLKTRREPIAPLWIAGHSHDWRKATVVKFLSSPKKDDFDFLAHLRTFGIWIVPDKASNVRGVIECADAAAARELEQYLHSLQGDNAALKTALDGPWLTLQWQTSWDFLSRATKR